MAQIFRQRARCVLVKGWVVYRDALEHAYHQDVMTCLVVAGVQIQYKGMYPTKAWCDAVLDLCSIYVGRITDRVCSLLSSS
jgi:hypothetical protein